MHSHTMPKTFSLSHSLPRRRGLLGIADWPPLRGVAIGFTALNWDCVSRAGAGQFLPVSKSVRISPLQ